MPSDDPFQPQPPYGAPPPPPPPSSPFGSPSPYGAQQQGQYGAPQQGQYGAPQGGSPFASPYGQPVVTPAAGAQVAGVGRRFLALLIDGVLLNAVLAPLLSKTDFATFTSSSTDGGAGFQYHVGGRGAVATGLVWFAYQALMTATRGQSLGKMATGLRVVGLDGGRVDAARALLRSAVQTVMWGTGVLGLVDVLVALFSDGRRSVHDRLAQTVVVRAR